MIKISFIVTLLAATLNIQAQILDEAELSQIKENNIATFEQLKRDHDRTFSKGIQTFAIVGTSLNCISYANSFSNIQAAIDAGFKEIRITTETYNENVVIDDKDVQLLGGYASCSHASSGIFDNNSVTTTVKPVNGSGQPAIRIKASNAKRDVTLRNLSAKNGEPSSAISGGGISIYNANLDLTLNTIMLAQNTGGSGGGLAVRSGHTNIKAHNLGIINNTAPYGGGIYCSGVNNSILIDGDENASSFGIVSNKATTGSGGGAYISNGCTFTSYVGASDGFDVRGFLNNKAETSGGALYVGGAGKVYLWGNKYCSLVSPNICYGDNSRPVNLSSNTALSRGGAIFAVGSGSAVYGSNIKVNANTADKGSAVYLMNEATFQTQTSYDNGWSSNNNGPVFPLKADHCWSNGKCNQFIGNSAFTSIAGSVFYVKSGSQLKMSRSHIEDNQSYGTFMFNIGDIDTSFDLEDSYVTGNGTQSTNGNLSPIAVYSDASARIINSTIADNNASSSSVRNYSANLKMYSSIIHDITGAEALDENNPVSSDTDCLIVNKLGHINDPRSMVADPKFVDRANKNYHINAATSPAVDYCDNSLAQVTSQDTDREDRGWDDYTVNNLYGPYDIGADETYDNDIIFKDGFE